MTQTVNPFAISKEAADRLNQGMNLGGGIELPFKAPVFWWMNGQPQAKPFIQATPALYYGGWASGQDAIEEVKDERGGVPTGLALTDVYAKNGKVIPSYTSRALVVAPIGFRSCWYKGDNGSQTRSVQYFQGGRQHIQVLALTGIQRQDKSYQSWGPIVISAKGYQASYLQSALKDWKKALEIPRRQYAPDVPAWAFWCALGTFQKEAESHLVGKTGAQSPVTPINLFIPKEITEAMMIRLYVGSEAVDEMVQLLDSSQEWLNAWKQQGQNGAKAAGGLMDDEDYIPPEPVGEENEIPF